MTMADDKKIGEQVSSIGNAVKEGVAGAVEKGSDLAAQAQVCAAASPVISTMLATPPSKRLNIGPSRSRLSLRITAALRRFYVAWLAPQPPIMDACGWRDSREDFAVIRR